MSTRKKILIGAIALPICLIISFVFASLFTANSVEYFNFSTRDAEFYIWLVVLFLINTACILAFSQTSVRKKTIDFFQIFDKKAKLEPLAIILCGIVAIMFFFIAHYGPTDYKPHTEFALEFDWSSLGKSIVVLAHPLWHFFTSIFVKAFYFAPVIACGLSTAIFCSLTFLVTRAILIYYVDDSKYNLVCDVFAMLLMYMQPLYIKQFNPNQIIGQGSPFMLHNPTSLAVQPFALICTFILIKILKTYFKDKNNPTFKEYLRLSFFSFLSTLAKPSFLQVFLPAIFVLLIVPLILNKFKDIKFCLKLVAAFTPSILNIIRVLIFEFIFPTSSDGGIAIEFFSVWSAQSPFVPLSIILAAGFCLFYIILKNKKIINKLDIGFILICWIIGILEFGFITETGYRKFHGNFSWGYCTSLSLMYVFVTAELLKNSLSRISSIKRLGVPEILAFFMLSVQFVQGIIYFFSIV